MKMHLYIRVDARENIRDIFSILGVQDGGSLSDDFLVVDISGDSLTLPASSSRGSPVRYLELPGGSDLGQALEAGLREAGRDRPEVCLERNSLAALAARGRDSRYDLVTTDLVRVNRDIRAPGTQRKGPSPAPEWRLVRRPACGIVLYNPDAATLRALVRSVAGEVGSLLVIDNSAQALDGHFFDTCGIARDSVRYEFCNRNIGLGAAYQKIVALAAAGGAHQLILFDQDSTPLAGTVAALQATAADLEARGERPAVVGPRPVAARDATLTYKAPRLFWKHGKKPVGPARPAWFVISSGSLISMRALGEIGGFDEDFFIDALDIEWGFRAWAGGYSCWIASGIEMPHRLGLGRPNETARIRPFPMQIPWRLRQYAHNNAVLLRRRYAPLGWKITWLSYFLAQLVSYTIRCRGDFTRPSAMASGFLSGLRAPAK